MTHQNATNIDLSFNIVTVAELILRSMILKRNPPSLRKHANAMYIEILKLFTILIFWQEDKTDTIMCF